MTLEHGDPPSDDEEELFRAIPERHSNRQAFESRDVADDLAEWLVAEARDEGVGLHLVRGDDRAEIARLIGEGDRIQMADKHFRRELASWVHPNRSRSHDGMRGYGLGFGELMSHAGPLVIRSFDLGRGQAARDRELAEGSPLLSVFVTDSDDPAAWLATGQGLSRVLLRARSVGVWSSFLNQPIEVTELRPRLAETIGRQSDHPQLMVRFGYGPSIKPEPRRPVREVLWDERASLARLGAQGRLPGQPNGERRSGTPALQRRLARRGLRSRYEILGVRSQAQRPAERGRARRHRNSWPWVADGLHLVDGPIASRDEARM